MSKIKNFFEQENIKDKAKLLEKVLLSDDILISENIILKEDLSDDNITTSKSSIKKIEKNFDNIEDIKNGKSVTLNENLNGDTLDDDPTFWDTQMNQWKTISESLNLKKESRISPDRELIKDLEDLDLSDTNKLMKFLKSLLEQINILKKQPKQFSSGGGGFTPVTLKWSNTEW